MKHFIFVIVLFVQLSVGAAAAAEGSFKLPSAPAIDERQRHRMSPEPTNPERQSSLADYIDYLREVCEQYNVPFNLMRAIIDQESKYHVWAVNVEGKGYFFKTKAEAMDRVGQSVGRSFDLGLMQINVQWLRKFSLRAEDVIEPYVNILLGVYIMNENLIAYGPTWRAVAAYHTPPDKNPNSAVAYAKNIWARYRKLDSEKKQP